MLGFRESLAEDGPLTLVQIIGTIVQLSTGGLHSQRFPWEERNGSDTKEKGLVPWRGTICSVLHPR